MILLDVGAQVESTEEDGMWPVHFAALSGDPYILDLLLDAGANPAARDDQGKTVLDYLPADVVNDPKIHRKWKELVAGGRRKMPDVVKSVDVGADVTVPDDDDAPDMLLPR